MLCCVVVFLSLIFVLALSWSLSLPSFSICLVHLFCYLVFCIYHGLCLCLRRYLALPGGFGLVFDPYPVCVCVLCLCLCLRLHLVRVHQHRFSISWTRAQITSFNTTRFCLCLYLSLCLSPRPFFFGCVFVFHVVFAISMADFLSLSLYLFLSLLSFALSVHSVLLALPLSSTLMFVMLIRCRMRHRHDAAPRLSKR